MFGCFPSLQLGRWRGVAPCAGEPAASHIPGRAMSEEVGLGVQTGDLWEQRGEAFQPCWVTARLLGWEAAWWPEGHLTAASQRNESPNGGGGRMAFPGRSPAPGSELLTLRKPSSHYVVLRVLTPSYRTLCTISSITPANLAKHILGQLKL